jgi:pimeloyl-ACP methyl ester carboxylesterase
MASVEARRLKLWQGRVETEVAVSGKGPPLVYLHGPWGLGHDRAFLDRLGDGWTVYAPHHPGTTRGDPNAVHQLDDWLDLVVYHGELFDALGLDKPILVGHSFGGMVACEIAAAHPARVKSLVLIDPVGLWRDDAPVRNWMIFSDEERRRGLFADPVGEAAKRFFAVPSVAAERVAAVVGRTWSEACTGKFVWPIPDKGLKKRIHRIAAPTLVLWGEADGVIGAAYAREFADRIAGARVALVERAGHLPHLERPDEVVKLVTGFLRNGARG